MMMSGAILVILMLQCAVVFPGCLCYCTTVSEEGESKNTFYDSSVKWIISSCLNPYFLNCWRKQSLVGFTDKQFSVQDPCKLYTGNCVAEGRDLSLDRRYSFGDIWTLC